MVVTAFVSFTMVVVVAFKFDPPMRNSEDISLLAFAKKNSAFA